MARTKHARPDIPFMDLKTRNTEIASDIKNALCNLLDNIESGGSFATSGVFSTAPLPDLFLQEYGPIPLPLAPHDADAICEERTEGDEENVPRVEKSVDRQSGNFLHNQWEIEADKLDVRNPAWNKFVRRAAVKAAGDLGIKQDAGVVKAELVRARVWAGGACLPPYKEYADVNIEFKPLGSGYRLMLEYDFILPSPAKLPSLAHVYSEKDKLRKVLTAWNDSVEKDEATEESKFPTLLAYICYSHYTSQSLGLNVLQANDRLRAACLKDLCSQIDMGLYIAHLNRTRTGTCNYHRSRYGDEDDHHDIQDEDDDEIHLTKVNDLDGETVAGGLPIELDDHFIQSEPFDDIPDDEDFDYHHGFVTHCYRKTVLVMIPSVAKGEWLPEESKKSQPNKRKGSVEVIDLE